MIVKQKNRLDKYLSEKLYKSRSEVAKIISNGLVIVNGVKQTKLGLFLNINDEVVIEKQEIKNGDIKNINPIDLKIPIVFEDNYIFVIDKPKNILSESNKYEKKSLINYAHFLNKNSDLTNQERYGIVHRLDKDTTGLLIIAKNKKSFMTFKENINKIKKKYLALVHGNFVKNNLLIKVPLARSKDNGSKFIASDAIDAKDAITKIAIKKQYKDFSLIECELITGRTNQIRSHLSYIKHPIYNDHKYGKRESSGDFGHFLHAYEISFVHPINSKKIVIKSKLPKEFNEMLIKLEKC